MAHKTDFELNLNKWIEFCSWAKFYPDLFLDLIRPEKGGLNMHSDQRVYLRSVLRFFSVYGVFPRGWSKTFTEVLGMILVCIFFPDITIALTAQTKENAAELMKDKVIEILRYYPLLENEIVSKKFSKGDAEVVFKNGSRMDNLVNGHQSKGQRRKRINIEESALLNNEMFQDALKPIVEVPRTTVGTYAIVDPEELNQQINFFSTAGFRGSDEFVRSVDMVKNMINLKGEIVLGSSFWLATWYGRGSTKSQIFQKKREMSPIAFAQNYESKWVGATDGALVNINKLINCRSLTKPLIKTEDKMDEYFIGVDVARSESTANNQSSAAVCRVKRNKKTGRVNTIELVNTINISNTMNFTAQACEVKKLKRDFYARMVIVDGNGLGAGLVDELLKESTDPITGESLGCWDTINTDNMPETSDSDKCLFDMKAQSYQTKVITNFIDSVDSGKLRLLQKRKENEFTTKERENYIEKVLPYIQTDFLFEEIANLKLKTLPSGGLTVDKTVRKINKDRWSALAYCIFYIMEFENNIKLNEKSELELLEQYTFV
ncbi:hypothetical protein KQI61_07755 [Anaerocolumna aminovalerica]|uniref:hypothetical protein n=1 Tax=Anaerocolumna aminovalerica TaxID=1527 RepID=UPI001C0E9F86|nr:hypothetical protein [Anaerocolumna aminovalerica]MBU5332091.1 hypothetical protein [Anaerocolumna aminovalerica]